MKRGRVDWVGVQGQAGEERAREAVTCPRLQGKEGNPPE